MRADPGWGDGTRLTALARQISGAQAPAVTSRRSAVGGLLAAVLLLALTPVAPEAQQLLRFFGSVQWIAGTSMQLMTDSGASVAVDLTQADQSDYQALRNGELVVIDGVLSADRRRIIAREIWRDSGRGYWESP